VLRKEKASPQRYAETQRRTTKPCSFSLEFILKAAAPTVFLCDSAYLRGELLPR
jgi:hypothetical protein